MKLGFEKSLLSPAIALGLACMVATALPASAQPQATPAHVHVHDQASVRLRGAAETGLRDMIVNLGSTIAADGKLPAAFPIDVSSYAQLQQVTLGAGFEVLTVDPAPLMYASRTASLGRMAKSTGVWKFLILSKGVPVGLLEMNRIDGRWQAVGAGSAKLARDVSAAAAAAPDGAFRFIRIYQATSDVLEVGGHGNAERYLPLPSAQRSLSLPGAKMASGAMTSQELLPSLQAAVRTNLSRAPR